MSFYVFVLDGEVIGAGRSARVAGEGATKTVQKWVKNHLRAFEAATPVETLAAVETERVTSILGRGEMIRFARGSGVPATVPDPDAVVIRAIIGSFPPVDDIEPGEVGPITNTSNGHENGHATVSVADVPPEPTQVAAANGAAS